MKGNHIKSDYLLLQTFYKCVNLLHIMVYVYLTIKFGYLIICSCSY